MAKNEAICKEIWELLDAEMSKRRDSDYETDEEQMGKLVNAYAFFAEMAEKCGGKLEKLKLKPAEIHGGVTAYFTLLYIKGEDLARFSSIVLDMTALSIDSMEDGDVCISFTIPRVFRKK